MTNEEIYNDAGLSPEEISMMPSYIEEEVDFYDTPAFEKLYEYFAFKTNQMPYNTAKGRDGVPDEWIIDWLAANEQ